MAVASRYLRSPVKAQHVVVMFLFSGLSYGSVISLKGVGTMKQHRHTVEEIAAKLEEADALSARGRLHGDVAKALGISVMTYHRWRKARSSSRSAAPSPSRGMETTGGTQ